uniref:Stress-induced-phosphoprotein 1 n=2 Tax=Anoplophora glabripennis TaxID=217634 RepID=V5GU54_ANOGL
MMGSKLQDPRVLTTLSVLIGIDPGADEPMDTEPIYTPPPRKPEPKPEPKNEPEPDLPENKRLAQEEKERGNTFYKKKDFNNAIVHYTKAIEHDPTDITYYNNLAAVYFEQKEYDKCIKECEKAIEIGRENRADFKLIAKSFMRIGNAYKKMKDYKNAKVYYEKSMSEHRTPEIKTQLSEVEKVIKEEEKKAYINPEVAEKEKEIGNEYFKKGDYANAVKHYTEAIKRNPDDAKLYSNRAACYTKLAAFDLGLKDCDKCVELDPKFIKGWIRKGHILQGMQQSSKAITAFQKAMEIDPNNAEALQGYRACTIESANLDGDPEKIRQRAMADPEVQTILRDPAMRIILEQMQSDPRALQDHLKNPDIAAKIQKLLESGLIAIR